MHPKCKRVEPHRAGRKLGRQRAKSTASKFRIQSDARRPAPFAECIGRAGVDPCAAGLDATLLAKELNHVGIMTGRGVEQTAGGVTVIDDSFNGNPASMVAALGSLKARPVKSGRRIAILGDMLELGDRCAEPIMRNSRAICPASTASTASAR